jgi:hypothetical protein
VRAPGARAGEPGPDARLGRASRVQDMAQVGPRAAAPAGHLVSSVFPWQNGNIDKSLVVSGTSATRKAWARSIAMRLRRG